jgi:hypothetical protein
LARSFAVEGTVLGLLLNAIGSLFLFAAGFNYPGYTAQQNYAYQVGQPYFWAGVVIDLVLLGLIYPCLKSKRPAFLVAIALASLLAVGYISATVAAIASVAFNLNNGLGKGDFGASFAYVIVQLLVIFFGSRAYRELGGRQAALMQ